MKRGAIDHPKLSALAAALKIERWGAVGILESLWHWSARYAIQGDIGKWDDAAIADGIGWRKAPAKLIDALVSTRWLDRVEGPQRLVIHDITDHADNAWRQNLEDAGLLFWNSEGPRKNSSGRPRKTPAKLQNNSSETPEPGGENSTAVIRSRSRYPEPVARTRETAGPDWTGNRETDASIAECYRHLREIEALGGEDPTRVMLRASGAGGKAKPVPRPELLREPALGLTLRDLQRELAVLKSKIPAKPVDLHAERGY